MFANNNLTEADYLNAFEEMNVSSLIVYAEDPEFYSCYFKKNHPHIIFPPGGMSCDKVRKQILERKNSNVIGIIDGDFDDKFENDNLFKIDFYSIENIALIHHPSLLELRDSSLDYLKNNFDKFKKLLITFNGNEFNIKIGDRIPKKFHSYLRKKIKNKNNYIRYMNLKDFVLAFCNKKCPNFKKDLYDCIEFENLFSKNEFERLNKTIEAILRL